ncbi:MAG: hypothetical protein ABIY70_01145 [Capsulimonas sp.]|uniref:hypothetical protein n=1 Tax=Capsulimonas sp. TaxID=2494211 RepID=UPI003267D60C
MHHKLEEYLLGVSERLDPLPTLRRNEELREMRQHLLNAVIVNQEFGMSEDEAAHTAIKQYGPTEDIASQLVWAWRRGDKREKALGVWGGAACTMAIMFVLSIIAPPVGSALTSMYFALNRFLDPLVSYVWEPHTLALSASDSPSWILSALEAIAMFGLGSLSGGVTGFLFPKRGVVGTALGATVFFAVFLGPEIHRQPAILDNFRWGNLILMIAVMVLQSGVGAWRRTRYGRGKWRYAR